MGQAAEQVSAVTGAMDERLAGPMPDPGAMSFGRLRDSAQSVHLHLQIPPRSEILTFLEKKAGHGHDIKGWANH